MEQHLLKYDLLNSFEKKEVRDFIDFLFSKKKANLPSQSHNKKNLLAVSTWNDEDIKQFEENKKMFTNWPPVEW